jgi:hypothetical protein
MARNQNQTPGSDRGLQTAQPSALSDDTETPEPEELAPAPKLSPAEEIAALQARINALTAAQPAPLPAEPVPGSTIRPERGPLHPQGHPIFNAARPTGRAG